MAWVKVPADNHPVFLAALPKDPRISTIKMFGSVCGTVNGNMFAGLFGRSFMVKLSEADQTDALALDGAEPFDPMGNGRVMGNSIFMPEDVFGETAELKSWVRRAFDYAVTLPPKVKKTPKAASPKPKPKPKAASPKPKPKAASPKPKPRPKAAKPKPKRATARPRR